VKGAVGERDREKSERKSDRERKKGEGHMIWCTADNTLSPISMIMSILLS
jgi:hypothetical protein